MKVSTPEARMLLATDSACRSSPSLAEKKLYSFSILRLEVLDFILTFASDWTEKKIQETTLLNIPHYYIYEK